MRRFCRQFLLAVLAAVTLCATAHAEQDPFAALRFTPRGGITTVIVDTEGVSRTYSGVLDVTKLEQYACVERMAGYTLCYQGEEVLSVTLRDISAPVQGQTAGSALTANGYYAASFPVEDENHEAFLTGLTAENMQRVQAAEISAVLDGERVSLEDLAFIDAEKQYDIPGEGDVVDHDTNLCWAAASSNILHYTGWGRAAGFGSADYLLDRYTAAFNDDGGRSENGLSWFFNGYNAAQYRESGAVVDDGSYGTFTGYFPQYCVSDVMRAVDVEDAPWEMDTVLEALRQGCGVAASMGWYDSGTGQRISGHAITLWGFVLDKTRYDADPTDKAAYRALIISDSDSDITSGDNRRGAPNSLQVEPIAPTNRFGMDSWRFTVDDSYLESFTILRPVENRPAEDKGTRSVFQAPDVVVSAVSVGYGGQTGAFLPGGVELYLDIDLAVRSGDAFDGTLPLSVGIADAATGKTVLQEKVSAHMEALPGDNCSLTLELDKLPAGSYRVTVTVSPLENEAYLNNNSAETTFTVRTQTLPQDAPLHLSGAEVRKDAGSVLGTLYLTYDRLPDFAVRQVRVLLSTNGEDWETVYLGREVPEEIGGLYLLGMGDAVDLLLRVDPADGSGYSFSTEAGAAVADYHAVSIEGEAQTLAVRQGESTFLNDETLRYKLYNWSRLDFQYQVHILLLAWPVGSDEGEYLLDDDFFDVPESYFSASFSGSDALARMPAGKYDLEAYWYYEPVGEGGYQNRGTASLGELLVLPEDFSLTCGEPVTDAMETRVPYAVQAPYGSDFEVYLYYGTSPDRLTKGFYVPYTDFCDIDETGSFTLWTLPETTYYYQLSVKENGELAAEGECLSYTTPAFPGTAIGPEERKTLEMERGEAAYFTFTAPAEGGYTVSAAGAKGSLELRREDGDPDSLPTLEGGSRTLELAAGETVYLTLRADEPGAFTLATTAEPVRPDSSLREPERDIRLTLRSGERTGIETRPLQKSGTVTVTVSGADGSVSYYDPNADRWQEVFFTLEGASVRIPVVNPLERAVFYVKAYEGGDYTVCYTADVPFYTEQENSRPLWLPLTDGGVRGIVAGYDPAGRLLWTLTTEDDALLALPNDDTAAVKIFMLDGEGQPVNRVRTLDWNTLDDVDDAAGAGLLTYLTDADPDALLTRLDAAKLLAAFAGLDVSGAVLPADITDCGGLTAEEQSVVAAVLENRLMGAYDQNTFGPDDGLERNQLARLLCRLLGMPSTRAELRFSDVPEDCWYWVDATVLLNLDIVEPAEGLYFFGEDRADVRTALRWFTAAKSWQGEHHSFGPWREDGDEHARDCRLCRLREFEPHNWNGTTCADCGAQRTVTAYRLDDCFDADAVSGGFRHQADTILSFQLLRAEDGMFRPQDALTRGETAQLVACLALGAMVADALDTDQSPVADVPAGHPYAGYIAYCLKQGLMSTVSQDTFDMDGRLSGYQLAKLLLLWMGYDPTNYTGASWTVNVAKDAQNTGLLNDFPGSFALSDTVTREQAAKLVYNALVYQGEIASVDAGFAQSGGNYGLPVTLNDKALEDAEEVGVTLIKDSGEEFGVSWQRAGASLFFPVETLPLLESGSYTSVRIHTRNAQGQMLDSYRFKLLLEATDTASDTQPQVTAAPSTEDDGCYDLTITGLDPDCLYILLLSEDGQTAVDWTGFGYISSGSVQIQFGSWFQRFYDSGYYQMVELSGPDLTDPGNLSLSRAELTGWEPCKEA